MFRAAAGGRCGTGAVLWHYQDSNSGSDFWGAPAISNGHAYFGNQDGTLYAFGT